MKDFNYYATPKAKFFGYAEKKKMKQQWFEEIDEIAMTSKERIKAVNDIDEKAADKLKELNQPYFEELKELESEFWIDARSTLKYDQFLSEEGMQKIEKEAWVNGHHNGCGYVYSDLQEKIWFLKDILPHIKPECRQAE